jgi:ribosomal protein S13
MNRRKILYVAKEYFSFSSSERNGVILLIGIILLLFLVLFLLPGFMKDQPRIDVSKFENEINSFRQSNDSLMAIKSAAVRFQDTANRFKRVKPKTIPINKIELNTADSVALESLPGIGPSFARRIIKYRELLGGFHSLNQLTEVYGVSPELAGKVNKHLNIDTLMIKKLHINTDDFKKVNASPYISFDQTKLIFKLRTRQKIMGFDQLIKNKIFSDEEIIRLRPYLSFD